MIIYIEYNGVYREIHTEHENNEGLKNRILHCQYELANIDKEIEAINHLIRTCRNPYLAGELFSDRLKEYQIRKDRFSESLCLLHFAAGFKYPLDLSCEVETPEIFEQITDIKNFLEAAENHISKGKIKLIIEDAFKIGFKKREAQNAGQQEESE